MNEKKFKNIFNFPIDMYGILTYNRIKKSREGILKMRFGEFKVGQKITYKIGNTTEVISVEYSKSGQSVTIVEQWIDKNGITQQCTRKGRVTTKMMNVIREVA